MLSKFTNNISGVDKKKESIYIIGVFYPKPKDQSKVPVELRCDNPSEKQLKEMSDSMIGIPVTIEHPNKGMSFAGDWKSNTYGKCVYSDILEDGRGVFIAEIPMLNNATDHSDARISIANTLLEKSENLRSVSLGHKYEAGFDKRTGNLVTENFKPDHIAICQTGTQRKEGCHVLSTFKDFSDLISFSENRIPQAFMDKINVFDEEREFRDTNTNIYDSPHTESNSYGDVDNHHSLDNHSKSDVYNLVNCSNDANHINSLISPNEQNIFSNNNNLSTRNINYGDTKSYSHLWNFSDHNTIGDPEKNKKKKTNFFSFFGLSNRGDNYKRRSYRTQTEKKKSEKMNNQDSSAASLSSEHAQSNSSANNQNNVNQNSGNNVPNANNNLASSEPQRNNDGNINSNSQNTDLISEIKGKIDNATSPEEIKRLYLELANSYQQKDQELALAKEELATTEKQEVERMKEESKKKIDTLAEIYTNLSTASGSKVFGDEEKAKIRDQWKKTWTENLKLDSCHTRDDIESVSKGASDLIKTFETVVAASNDGQKTIEENARHILKFQSESRVESLASLLGTNRSSQNSPDLRKSALINNSMNANHVEKMSTHSERFSLKDRIHGAMERQEFEKSARADYIRKRGQKRPFFGGIMGGESYNNANPNSRTSSNSSSSSFSSSLQNNLSHKTLGVNASHNSENIVDMSNVQNQSSNEPHGIFKKARFFRADRDRVGRTISSLEDELERIKYR